MFAFTCDLQLKDVDEQMVALQAAISTADAAIGPSRSTRDSLLAQRNATREQQLAAQGQLEAQLRYAGALHL